MSEEKNDKKAALTAIAGINAVEGFDPSPLAVEYVDLNTKESRFRLPVMIQLAWFRLKYPEGKVHVEVSPGKDCFTAKAWVYPHYTAQMDHFLSDGEASRGYLADKPTVSPREWAQTAAVGIALRNAGFGLQFGAAGDAFDTPAVDEMGDILWDDAHPASGPQPITPQAAVNQQPPAPAAQSKPSGGPAPQAAAEPALSPLEQAMSMPCPITKYNGKTLGDVLVKDPKALVWVANKYTGDPNISAAAKLICEQAVELEPA